MRLLPVWLLAAGALLGEPLTSFEEWLQQDVAYIVTDAERAAFQQLQTDGERVQFIEQFWLRRKPGAKEEHYRRIAYANDHFSATVPGWKTDHGRIYIMYGPPDEIDSHPNGGPYDRPPEEGGGTTSTYPFEQWLYRYIEDVGSDIVIEFVDPTMSGEYRMTMDASEKDALLYVPDAGLTLMEQMGLSAGGPRLAGDGVNLQTAAPPPNPARPLVSQSAGTMPAGDTAEAADPPAAPASFPVRRVLTLSSGKKGRYAVRFTLMW